MPKKCILCDKEAEYFIKGCPEAYCKDCASEQFQDLGYLQKIEDKAEEMINKAINEEE